ncbi:MAG: hypothetical protein WCA22_18765 [Candidatus Binatus sp.]
MIELRSVLDELNRFDKLWRQRFCASCADEPEARASGLRLAFEKAAAKGQAGFMVCDNCAARWLPDSDVNHAVRDWVIVLSDENFLATLCGPCRAAHPEPTRLPRIAQLILSRSPEGPMQ